MAWRMSGLEKQPEKKQSSQLKKRLVAEEFFKLSE
jgi:hypothetical protein